jgi:hypothetical protein
MQGRALVTSVPKCGKNLVRSIFHAFNLQQRPFEDGSTAALHAYARWLGSAHERGRDPSVRSLVEETTPAFERALASVASLRDGEYVHGHFAYDERLHAAALEAGVPIVFVYRDPRACFASLAHFMVERGLPAELVSRLERRDVASAVRLLMDGDEAVVPFASFFEPYSRWRHAEGVIALRFEDVIGPRGHGSRMRQYAAISALASHVGRRELPWRLLDAASRAFNTRAGTFRRGTIDGWQDDLAGLLRPGDEATLHRLAAAWGFVTTETPAARSAAARPESPVGSIAGPRPVALGTMRRLALALLG